MKLSDLAGAKTVTATPDGGLAGGPNEMVLKAATLAAGITGTNPNMFVGKKQDKSEGQIV